MPIGVATGGWTEVRLIQALETGGGGGGRGSTHWRKNSDWGMRLPSLPPLVE